MKFPFFKGLEWCIFKWQVLFVVTLKRKKEMYTSLCKRLYRKTVGPFIVSKGPPMCMVWGSQRPSKICSKWKPWSHMVHTPSRNIPSTQRKIPRSLWCTCHLSGRVVEPAPNTRSKPHWKYNWMSDPHQESQGGHHVWHWTNVQPV